MTGVLGGAAALLLAVVLGIAGALKLVDRGTFADSLRRIVPSALWRRIGQRSPRRAATVVALAELATAAALLLLGGPAGVAVAGWAIALTAGFVWAVQRARRIGITCGCFGTIASGPAGTVETARAVAMVAVASLLLVLRAVGGAGRPPAVAAVAAVLCTALLVVVVRRRSSRVLDVVGASRLYRAGPARPPGSSPPAAGHDAGIVAAAARSQVARAASVLVEEQGGRLDWATAVVVSVPGSSAVNVAVSGPPGTRSSLIVRIADPDDERTFSGYACGPARCAATS